MLLLRAAGSSSVSTQRLSGALTRSCRWFSDPGTDGVEYDNTGYWKRARLYKEWRKKIGEMHAEGQERMDIFYRKAHQELAARGDIDKETLSKFRDIDAKMMLLQYDNDELQYHLGRGTCEGMQERWKHKWESKKEDSDDD